MRLLMKIKYLGKINKIISEKFKDEKINLKKKMVNGKLILFDVTIVFKFPFKAKYFDQDYYVSSSNFSAYKLIESWPNWPENV